MVKGEKVDQKWNWADMKSTSEVEQPNSQLVKSEHPLRSAEKKESKTKRKVIFDAGNTAYPCGKKKRSSDDWQTSDTIPDGWRVKNEGKGKAEFFLSPQGVQVPSRRAGLQLLVQEGSPQNLIEEMRSLLHIEGYQPHKYLPEKWLVKYVFRDINSKDLSILNVEGEEFKSFLRAEEFMQADPRYTNSHLELLKLLVEEKVIERRLSDPAWKSDPSVPEGWKLRQGSEKGEKEFLLWKDGRQFQGRRVALKMMVEEGWDSAQVEAMREKLEYEGWMSGAGLPRHWLAKKKGPVFVTETGEKVKSIKAALAWLGERQRVGEVGGLLFLRFPFSPIALL